MYLQWNLDNIARVSQASSAVISTITLIVLLFGKRIHFASPLRPRLRINMRNTRGLVTPGLPRSDNTPEMILWRHLEVHNSTRWHPITHVRVYLIEVQIQRGADFVTIFDNEAPVHWRYTREFGESLKDIGHDAEFDLLAVTDGEKLALTPIIGKDVPDETLFKKSDYPNGLSLKLKLQARGLGSGLTTATR